MKSLFYTFLLCLLWQTSPGQTMSPVDWTYSAERLKGDTVQIDLIAQIDEGWYIYSQFLDEGGPIPTSFHFDEGTYQLVGLTREMGEKIEGYDDIFEMDLVKFAGEVRFSQIITLTKPTGSITGHLMFMTCDNTRCLPPKQVNFDIALK